MEPERIPIFPLHTVLFPRGLLPLRVFEARYMDMTRECMRSGRPFGVCLIKEGPEVGGPARPHEVGCLARITAWDMERLGLLHLQTQGERRFRILEAQAGAQGLVSARVELIDEEQERALPDRFAACAGLLRRILDAAEHPPFVEPHQFDDAAWVGYRLAEILPLPLAVKQMLLELTDSLQRLEFLQRFLEQRGLAPGTPPRQN